MDQNVVQEVKKSVQASLAEFMEAKQLRDKVIPKLQAYEQERHSIEGQIQQILSQAGVSSGEELEELVKSTTAEFSAHASQMKKLFEQISTSLDEVDKRKAEAMNGTGLV